LSENENVTASIQNDTQYTLVYSKVNTLWGNYYNHGTTVGPNTTVDVFYAVGAEGAGTGCQGSVIYNFTDQNGNQQSITLSYEDPYIGDNSFQVPELPAGMKGSANQPSGGPVTVTYTISGSVT
jgi:hypothetical protein